MRQTSAIRYEQFCLPDVAIEVAEGTDCTGRQAFAEALAVAAEVQDSAAVVRVEIAMGVYLSVGLD